MIKVVDPEKYCNRGSFLSRRRYKGEQQQQTMTSVFPYNIDNANIL